MKLIVDISEDTYTRLFDNGIQDNEIAVDDVCEMARALRLGTPLDDVKAEIRAEQEKYSHPLEIERAIEILDNVGETDMRGE